MRRLRVIPFFLALFCLMSCSGQLSDPLAYQYSAAEITMQGQLDDLSFSADLQLCAVDVENGETVDRRDFVLTYTAPATLAGLTVARQNGEMYLARGDLQMPISETYLTAIALPCQLFCIDCLLGSASVVKQNGTTLNRISVADDEGNYILWLDTDGLPRRIEAVFEGRQLVVDLLVSLDENSTMKE